MTVDTKDQYSSPYVYCDDNPLAIFDPDGRSGMEAVLLCLNGKQSATDFYNSDEISKEQYESTMNDLHEADRSVFEVISDTFGDAFELVTGYTVAGREGDRVAAAIALAIPAASSKIVKEVRGTLSKKLGGQYDEIATIKGNEKHHMHAHSATNLSRGKGPAISMEKADHKKTASWGPTKDADKYRTKQKELVKKGKFKEA